MPGQPCRWLSPDPYGWGAADLGNPQSLNRYAYVLNLPLSSVDPLGLFYNGQRVPDGSGNGSGYSWVNGCLYYNDPVALGELTNSTKTIPILIACMGDLMPGWTPGVPGGGGGGGNSPAPNNGTVKCSGSARVLQGNSATIGHPGGFSGPSVGNFPVTANGAAVIPSQWGPSKAFLRPYLNQISGVFPNVNYSFTGIVDVMGGAPPPSFPAGSNVQTDLMQLNPGKLILELPGAPQDFGTTA